MDGLSSFGSVTVLLLAALTSSALGQSPPYFEDGKPLVLTPLKHGTAITSVVWHHNRNLVVEWVNNEMEFFGSFKERTKLDQSTAQLTVNNAKQTDGGEYEVEINNEKQSPVYEVKVIKRVTKPSVKVRNPPCDKTSSKCILTCQGDTAGTQPLTYSWRKDSGAWGPEQESMDHTIYNDTETEGVKEFFCRMKNPINPEESDPFPNPFYPETLTDPAKAGIGIGVIIILLLGGIVVWKFGAIKKRFCAESGPI